MKIKILPILLGLLVLGITEPAFAADPHFSLSPASGNQSGSFNVEVKIDTGGNSAGGADVLLEYPKNLLKIDSFTKTISDSKAFPEVYSLIKNDEGRLRFFAYPLGNQAGDAFNGTDGSIGTIRFTVLGSGTAAVNFICTPGATNDTGITSKTDSQDIVVCSANVNGSYVLTSSGTGTPTPTPTGTGARNTSTPTPTTASSGGNTATPTTAGSTATPTARPTTPVSGMSEYTIGIMGLGVLVLLTGLALRT